jgi:LysM repeat protein
MRTSRLFALFSLSAYSVILSSCGNSGGGTAGRNPGGTGPFDRNGNYVEAWADTPSKWGKRSSTPVADDVPAIASNEQPPSAAVPLSDIRPVETVKNTSTPLRTTEVVVASKQKPKTTEIVSRPKTKIPEESIKPTRTKTKASEETVSTKSKTKPKVVVKIVKPKPSPSPRYVVKKGDSLSVIASRNNTSVSALQKANGLSGTLIQPGKSLVIPR